MIYGIGTDIVEIERIRSAAGRWGDRFLRRIFSEAELAYCFKRGDPFSGLAARFAAKEAMIKASGVNLTFRDIEVKNEESGRPFLLLRKGAGGPDFDHENLSIHLSLSHEMSHAVAMVIVERKEKKRV